MKNFLFLFILTLFSITLYSQNEVYEKFADAKLLNTPYTDNIQFTGGNQLEITEADWLNFGFSALEDFDSDFTYNVYGTIMINDKKVLLINRNYREENNHWAVYISDDKRIISNVNIAYENSEGVLFIESEMSNDKIIVKETTHFDVTPSETTKEYFLTDTGFKEK